jgi:hypothetical protein
VLVRCLGHPLKTVGIVYVLGEERERERKKNKIK